MSNFGTIPPEPPRQHDLSACAPRFAAAVTEVLAALTAEGFDPVVYEAMRSDARQTWLYGFGRDYDDGRGIVTHAQTTAHGWHGSGLAADIISAAHGWDSRSFFDALAATVATHELTSGSFWQMQDRPHVQWGKCRTTPSDASPRLVASGGLPALWAAVGAA
jgi:hypothetical protein